MWISVLYGVSRWLLGCFQWSLEYYLLIAMVLLLYHILVAEMLRDGYYGVPVVVRVLPYGCYGIVCGFEAVTWWFPRCSEFILWRAH